MTRKSLFRLHSDLEAPFKTLVISPHPPAVIALTSIVARLACSIAKFRAINRPCKMTTSDSAARQTRGASLLQFLSVSTTHSNIFTLTSLSKSGTEATHKMRETCRRSCRRHIDQRLRCRARARHTRHSSTTCRNRRIAPAQLLDK